MPSGYEGWGQLGTMLAGGDKAGQEKAYVDQLNRNYTAYGNLEQARKERAQAMIAQGQVDARSTLQDRINAQYKAHGMLSEDAGVAGAFALSDSTPSFNTHMGGTEKVADATMDMQIREALEKGDLKRARILSAVKTDKVLPQSRGGEIFDPVSLKTTTTPLGDATLEVKEQQVKTGQARQRATEAGIARADRKSRLSEINNKIKEIETVTGKPISVADRVDLMDQFLETGEFSYADKPAELGNRPTSADANTKTPRLDGSGSEMDKLKAQATQAIEANPAAKAKIIAKLKAEIIRRKLK